MVFQIRWRTETTTKSRRVRAVRYPVWLGCLKRVEDFDSLTFSRPLLTRRRLISMQSLLSLHLQPQPFCFPFLAIKTRDSRWKFHCRLLSLPKFVVFVPSHVYSMFLFIICIPNGNLQLKHLSSQSESLSILLLSANKEKFVPSFKAYASS